MLVLCLCCTSADDARVAGAEALGDSVQQLLHSAQAGTEADEASLGEEDPEVILDSPAQEEGDVGETCPEEEDPYQEYGAAKSDDGSHERRARANYAPAPTWLVKKRRRR
jgi:hypothetical protein